MQKWEYLRILQVASFNRIDWTINGQAAGVPSFEAMLNQMGNDGWELVGLTSVASNALVSGAATTEYILKRPLP
jgi:hypothetical protein